MLSIVIPAFNEENILQKSIDQIITWSKNNSIKLEVIVINNNSTDKTELICKDNLSKYKNFKYQNELKKGKGFAVKKGIKTSSYTKVLILDADLSVGIDQFNLSWLDFEEICIVGSRFIGKVIGTPYRRILTGKIFSSVVKSLFSISVDDTQCGFKYISSSNIHKLIDKLTVGNFAYDIDFLLSVKSCDIKTIVMPVTYVHNKESSVNIFKDSFRMLITLFKLKKKNFD
tara:strand:- start:23880 stop:24566 length:687 start_codon:yes stop_codon:yes gene_type:complete